MIIPDRPNAKRGTPIDEQLALIRPRRKITGMSAVLLPFRSDGTIAWSDFERHVARTHQAGLIPAVNMDTGYVNLLDDATRLEVLSRTRQVLGAGTAFVAGAFVGDQPDATFQLDAYCQQMEMIQQAGGTPVIFQSYGLTRGDDQAILSAYQQLAQRCERFIGFELGTMFAPFGKIYSLELYQQLLKIPACIGAKHSSLRREAEWARLRLRDEVRPDFQVLTGNDLAIDMVMYGSDYLLGLSSFAPDWFATRDRWWLEGDDRFYGLNDILQYLGFFAFRQPVPAYKHSAAMFMKLRGWIEDDRTHPESPERPGSDRGILAEVLGLLEAYV